MMFLNVLVKMLTLNIFVATEISALGLHGQQEIGKCGQIFGRIRMMTVHII